MVRGVSLGGWVEGGATDAGRQAEPNQSNAQ